MKRPIIIALSILVFCCVFFNCNKQKSNSIADSGQSTFYEIFPQILDSIHIDVRLLPPSPIPPNLLEEKGYVIENTNDGYTKAFEKWKKSDEFKDRARAWKKRTDSIRRDTTSFFIIVQDSIKYWENKGIEYFRDIGNSSDTIDFIKRFKIDKNKLITNHKNIKFKYRNEFHGELELWKRTRKHNIVAIIDFSRIIFDESKSQVVLDVSYVRGILSGAGYKINLVKTENGKWIIDKIKGSWIS